MTDGGVQRSFLALAAAFQAKGCAVDLVVGDGLGRHRQAIPDGVELITLTSGSAGGRLFADAKFCWIAWRRGDWRQVRGLRQRWRSFLPGLTRYLDEAKPDALLSAKTLVNIVALTARRWSDVETRVVVSERTHLSTSIGRSRRDWKASVLPPLIRDLYGEASGIVGISGHVADDIAEIGEIDRAEITTIHNGLLRPEAIDLPAADHPWFSGAAPVILSVGRLSKEKDFPTLIRAFSLLRERRDAKLIIVGEGRERASLEALKRDLGIIEDVDLPGFSDNPYAFMKTASLFVMSSTHEGFGNVLLEALAAGCPSMSTDCPGGPPEILDGGRVGPLVPVGDPKAMAAEMARMLDHPPARQRLIDRAAEFGMDRVAERYLALLLPERFGASYDSAA
jgi:glycosyltransferase involved in cell wall biosynthesis